MALRALKSEEDIAGVPLDQPILIELPGGISPEEPEEVVKTEKKPAPEPAEPDAKRLQEQLEALQAAQRADRERADRAERLADQRAKEADEARKRNVSLESDIITGGLSAAQSDRDAAKVAFRTAFEAGDASAMADAQSRMGRAEAKILALESGAAEVAERKEVKPEPQQQRQVSWEDQVRGNPNLMSAERDWMLKNETAFRDRDFNIKLNSAYEVAMHKGLIRGSQEYFDHIERATGLKTPEAGEEREVSMQAPVSRSERGPDGKSPSRVTLTPEERDMAKSMGVSEIDYARQKVAFEAARKADPERYSNRG